MIHLPPNTAAIQLQVKNLIHGCPAIRPPGELAFVLERDGCNSVEIDGLLLSEDWPTVTVRLEGVEIERGYYDGLLSVGCAELCRVKFWTGQNLCFDAVPLCGDNLIGMEQEQCQVKCNTCDGKILQRTYRVLARHHGGGVTLLADEDCIEIPDCEVCPECTG